MDYFSIFVLLLAGLFLWWVIKERGRSERERQVSVELVNRLFRMDERLLKLETAFEQRLTEQKSTQASPDLSDVREPVANSSGSEAIAASPVLILPADKPNPQVGEPAQTAPHLLPAADERPTAAKAASPLAPAYIHGVLTPTASAREAALVNRKANNGPGQKSTPKLDELGMAALLCGIALIAKDDPSKKKTG